MKNLLAQANEQRELEYYCDARSKEDNTKYVYSVIEIMYLFNVSRGSVKILRKQLDDRRRLQLKRRMKSIAAKSSKIQAQ